MLYEVITVALWVTVIIPEQLSVAVGAVNSVTSHSAVTSGKAERSATGGVTSSIRNNFV